MPDLERPVGVPAVFADHAKLMFDLQILAFQADITRIVTFQLRASRTITPIRRLASRNHIIPPATTAAIRRS